MADSNSLNIKINSKEDVERNPKESWELIRRLRQMLNKSQEAMEKAEGEVRRLKEENER
jgi:hypothetical protein